MSSIKTLIDAYIKRNANQEITGPVLNGVLTAIADALGTPFIGEDGYWYEYDQETGEYVSSGTPAQGESGVNDAWAAVGVSPDPQPLPSVDVNYNPTLRQLSFTFYDIQGPKGDQGTPGITGASVSVDANVGTPSVDASIVNSILTLAFHNLRGAAAGFGTPTISVGANQGTPSASVTASGPDTAKVFAFAFDGLKGETGPQGPQGPQGNPGSSQDYPFTLANNLTTDDSTVALTAAMGVQLEGEVSQLSQEVNGFAYELEFEAGYIDPSGSLVAPDGYSQCTSQMIPASIANGLTIKFGASVFGLRLAFFNGETLVSRSSIYASSPVTIETEYSVRITLMTRFTGTSYSVADMVACYTFIGLPVVVGVRDLLENVDKEINGSYIDFGWKPGYINSSGEHVPQDGYSQYTSKPIPPSVANKLSISFNNSSRGIILAYYDGDTFDSRTGVLSSPVTIDTDKNVRIVLRDASSGHNYTIEQMLSGYTFSGDYQPGIEDTVDTISGLLYGTELEWESGNIDSSGNIIAPTQSNYYSQILPNSEINGISLQVDAGYLCNLAFYENGVFKGRYGWIYTNDGKVTITTQYDARIMIGRDTFDNTKTAEEVASHIHIEAGLVYKVSNLDTRVTALENRVGAGDFIPKLIACDFDGKILHFSFDDTCWCLYDLIQNANTYESIFDEPFFGMLKEVHDSTGMVFTLNTFNEIATNTSGYYPTGFDISSVPTKFQSDFQANKGWLKFSFHAKDENTNYNTASGAGTDYGVFVSAIYTLTGDYDCIDHVTRLGYFGGTKENCLALRDAEHGIIGFFGADDTRSYDYYLSSSQYAWLRKKGKYFDAENEMFFIKTQYRTFATGKQDVENNLCFQKVTEFFVHEYEAHPGANWDLTAMKNNILSLATWATGLGYKFEYPEKIYG